jgi:starch phosphorylase
MEYGLHQSLAIYSGGLGVLSGDHCKSASDLGVPLVAVGLLYRSGYFRQTIDPEGRQQHFYPEYDFSRLPLRPAAGPTGRAVTVKVPFPGRDIVARVWVAQVGRVPLLLLDTDTPENDPADRPITNNLYVRGRDMRLAQELVLGAGGVRALAALGIEPQGWHLNEGHSALLQLERLREAIAAGASDPEAALRDLARHTAFTTHTPVPAGNEQFDRALAARYLEPWSEVLGLGVERLLALGDADHAGSFNLTAMGLKTSRFANAVSRLNAEVTNRMWGHLAVPRNGDSQGDEPPIEPITNGVHTPTWVGREMRALFDRHLGPQWQDLLLDEEAWRRVLEIPDAEIWEVRQAQKARLGRFCRSRWREQFGRHGRSPEQLREVAAMFDDRALTIGFARRFATYKRAQLIFKDIERLRRLLNRPGMPVQILFAGKAHPADLPGQELIQQIVRMSGEEGFAGRVFFLEDYDMRIGGMMVQGADVWLNTPRMPMEASGTSGQKASLNGALNVSILDGWWPEGWDGTNGWAIGTAAPQPGDDEAQDVADAAALYALLEDEVVPEFHDRPPVPGNGNGNGNGREPLPTRWIARVKDAIATVTPRFSSDRMVRDYVERAYMPLTRR